MFLNQRLRILATSLFFLAGLSEGYGAVQNGGAFINQGPGQYNKITLGERTGTNVLSGLPVSFGTYSETVTDSGTGELHLQGDTIVFTNKWPSRIDYDSVDLTARTYDLYIPEGYDASEPYGIVLHYNAGAGAEPPNNLLPLLAERKLIFVGATQKGNYEPTDERLAWGLMGFLRAMELFNIDTDRIYIQGGSGGSRTGHTLTFYHPELFRGVFGSVGSAYPERLPNCYETKYPNSHYETQYVGHWSNVAFRSYPRQLGLRYYCITGFSDFREGDNMNVYHYGFERNGFVNRLYSEPGSHGVGSVMAYKAAIDFIEHPRVELDAATEDLSDSGASVVESGSVLTLVPSVSATAAAQTLETFHWCDPYGAEIRFQYQPETNATGALNQKTDIGLWGKSFSAADTLPIDTYSGNDRGGLILSISHNGSSETFSIRFVQPQHPNPALRDLILCSGEFTDWPNASAKWDSENWSSLVDQTINTNSLDVRINAWEDQIDIIFGKHLNVSANHYPDYLHRLDDQRTLRLRFNGDSHTLEAEFESLLALSNWIKAEQTVLAFASGAASGATGPGSAAIENLSLTYAGDLEHYDLPVFQSQPIIRGPLTATVPFSSTITNEVFDPNHDVLTFSKVDGPDWLTVESDGHLHGTPGYTNGGLNLFTIEISDSGGLSAQGQLEIDVSPHYIDPVELSATVVEGISDQLSNYVPGELEYQLQGGPDWLSVATDGAISGMPAAENLGNNRFDILLLVGGEPLHMLALTVSVSIADVLKVNTHIDDDDTLAAQLELDGAGGMPGAWAALNDSTGFSLREAIWFAEAMAGPDIIQFDKLATTWQGNTILLDGSQLMISSDLEIDGGDGVTIDAGAQNFRVLEIDGGEAGADLNVVLKNLTFENGRIDKATGAVNGGGILNRENLSMFDCTVSANAAIGGNANWAYGMGIKSDAALLHLERCRVIGNYGDFNRSQGGAIHAGGRVRIIDSVISDNRTKGGSRSDKGGIHIGSDSTLVVLNSSIYGNSVSEAVDPAGVFVSATSSAKIISSVVAGNRVGSGTANAQDLVGPATLYDCLVSDDVVFGSGITDGGGNLTGASYASEMFDGTVENSGTDAGAITYTDGVNYFNHDGAGAYSRVTSLTDVMGGDREQNLQIDIGAYEADGDSDDDGMPNYWEQQHGLSSQNPLDATGNLDGDGLNNLEEFLADTNPTNAASSLMISDLNFTNGHCRISWQGGQNAFQYLEYSANLESNTWNVLEICTPPTLLSNSFSATNLSLFPKGYFRIRANR